MKKEVALKSVLTKIDSFETATWHQLVIDLDAVREEDPKKYDLIMSVLREYFHPVFEYTKNGYRNITYKPSKEGETYTEDDVIRIHD